MPPGRCQDGNRFLCGLEVSDRSRMVPVRHSRIVDGKLPHCLNIPKMPCLESLELLAIPEDLRQDYLSLQLTALPGWAGFIKWRAEQQSYAWQQAYPVSLVKFLAVRLWYVRELVQKVCGEELGNRGTLPDDCPPICRMSRTPTFCRRNRSPDVCRPSMPSRWSDSQEIRMAKRMVRH